MCLLSTGSQVRILLVRPTFNAMKIIVVSKYCGDSSRELVEALQANNIDAWYLAPDEYERKAVGPHKLFAYGWSGSSKAGSHERINLRHSTRCCIDKVSTLCALNEKGIPVPGWCQTKHDVPKAWEHVVVRESRTGRKAEGFAIVAQCDGEVLPDGELYTEYFYHKYEYRIVVFKDQAFVYYKRRINDGTEHEFVYRDPLEFLPMVKDARKAAKALNIDYVGFDVVAQNKRSYRFLEANSGPILTDEVRDYIVAYYKD